MSAAPSTCRSRSGVWRQKHSLDREGVCVFCDLTPKRARARCIRESLDVTLARPSNLGNEGDWFENMRAKQMARRAKKAEEE